jgi:hypothetical protein
MDCSGRRPTACRGNEVLVPSGLLGNGLNEERARRSGLMLRMTLWSYTKLTEAP